MHQKQQGWVSTELLLRLFSGLFRFSVIFGRNELLRRFRRSRKSFLFLRHLFFKKIKMRFKMVIFTNGLQNRKHLRFLPEHFNAEIFGKLKSWHLGGLHLCHSHSLSLSHPCTHTHSLSHFLSIPSSLLLTLSLSLSPCLILALGLPLSSMTFFCWPAQPFRSCHKQTSIWKDFWWPPQIFWLVKV